MNEKDFFKLIRDEIGDKKIIYLGSSIHIKPSFYFSNALYVDKSEIANKFFHDIHHLKKLIAFEKRYKKEAKIEFLSLDFKKEMVKLTSQYDLLISLYAGDMIEVFLLFIRNEGYILTSDFYSGANFLEKNNFPFVKMISRKRLDEYQFITKRGNINDSKLIGKAKDLSFKDNQTYFLYKKK